jgi:hypothetical protein
MSNLMKFVGPVLVAILYIAACSFFREPNRRNFNAIMIAGAGAAYLNGGFGIWEFGFTAMVTYIAYRGLRSYTSSASAGFSTRVGTCCTISTGTVLFLLRRPHLWVAPFVTL